MQKLIHFWDTLPDSLKRILHTFWQTFFAVFLVGLSGVFTSPDFKTAIVALLTASFAAGFSAVKAYFITLNER